MKGQLCVISRIIWIIVLCQLFIILSYVNIVSVYVKFLEYNLIFSPRHHDCNILHVRTHQVAMYTDYFHISFSYSSFGGSVLMTSSTEVKMKCMVSSVSFYTLHKTLP